MPSIYQLKPAFQNLLRPFVRGLFRMGVTANMVTVLAMLISFALAFFIYFHFQNQTTSLIILIYPLWMLIRMAFNAVDGMLAREFHQQSNLGAYLNELCDVISDTALYLCFITFAFIQTELLLLICFLALLSEYTGVMAPLIGSDRRYDGPMGKSDRAFWFSLLAVIIYIYPFISNNNQMISYITNGLILFIGLLLILTIYNRIKNSVNTHI